MTTGLALLLEALVAPSALEAEQLLPCKEGFSITVSIAVKERHFTPHSLLDRAGTFSISIVDRRAVKA